MFVVPLLASLGPWKLFYFCKKSARLAIFGAFERSWSASWTNFAISQSKIGNLVLFLLFLDRFGGLRGVDLGLIFYVDLRWRCYSFFSVFFTRFSMLRRQSTQVFENARHANYIVFYDIKSMFLRFTLERFGFEFAKYHLKVQLKSNVKICVFLTKKSYPKRFLRE